MKTTVKVFYHQINSMINQSGLAPTLSKLLILGIVALCFTPCSLNGQIIYKVTTLTGDNGSDASIYIQFKGTRTQEDKWTKKRLLDTDGYNDFEYGQEDTYELFFSGSEDIGIVTEVQLQGESGRSLGLEKLSVERTIAPGVQMDNVPFVSTFNTISQEPIAGKWVSRTADNIREVAPRIAEVKSTTERKYKFTATAFDLINDSAATSETDDFTVSETKGYSLTNTTDRSSTSAWDFGISQSIGYDNPLAGISSTTTLSFNKSNSSTQSQSISNNTSGDNTISRTFSKTKDFTPGKITYVVLRYVVLYETGKVEMLNQQSDYLCIWLQPS